jgi:processive 1,2-diacylglycerol beta-glucosyltransferase/1,2-diacylglycerol 3-beta-galactosyltransferase
VKAVGRERVLFLYLPTGGGHLSNSKAISQKIADRYGAETLIYDPVSARSRLGRILLEDSYRFVSIRMPNFWNLVFKFNATKLVMTMSQNTTRNFGRQGLRYIIDEWKPTKIVCLHHLLPPAIKDELVGRPYIPVTVIATDPFVPPPLWAHRHEFPIICMSEEALGTFLAMGVPRERLRAFSIIIGEKFNTRQRPDGRAAYLSSIGLDPLKRFVLIAGGGDGMRGADRILEELCSSKLEYQVAVVCGRDEATRKRADEVARRHGLNGRKVVVFGFTDAMYELMGSADAIVSKAGPAVLGEILASGKPNIIAFYIPGQEKANVRWVEEHGVGVYHPKPTEMREAVERILTDDAYRQGMECNIAAIGFKNGLDDIARAIME